MIHGIGVDIIEVERIQSISEKNPKFLTRIFTETEITYCSKMKNKYQHLAARFAAKEAFFKALGRKIQWTDIGIKNLPKEAFFKALGRKIQWTDIGIKNLPSGKPVLEILSEEEFPFSESSVSISHIKDYAVATVILSR